MKNLLYIFVAVFLFSCADVRTTTQDTSTARTRPYYYKLMFTNKMTTILESTDNVNWKTKVEISTTEETKDTFYSQIIKITK